MCFISIEKKKNKEERDKIYLILYHNGIDFTIDTLLTWTIHIAEIVDVDIDDGDKYQDLGPYK